MNTIYVSPLETEERNERTNYSENLFYSHFQNENEMGLHVDED